MISRWQRRWWCGEGWDEKPEIPIKKEQESGEKKIHLNNRLEDVAVDSVSVNVTQAVSPFSRDPFFLFPGPHPFSPRRSVIHFLHIFDSSETQWIVAPDARGTWTEWTTATDLEPVTDHNLDGDETTDCHEILTPSRLLPLVFYFLPRFQSFYWWSLSLL